VFYPRGGSWEHYPAVMYGNGWSKDLEAHQTFREFVSYDSTQFLNKTPSTKIVDIPPLLTSKGEIAFVRKFLYKQFEIIAYIDEPTIVAMIVLTAKSKEAFDESYSAFEKLVYSYRYLSNNSITKVTDFAVASKAADANLNSEEGKKYDEECGGQAGSSLSQDMLRCTTGLQEPDLGPFTVLIRVGINGRAEEILVQPRTKVAECIEPAFNAFLYLKPPGPSWWIKININIKDQ